MNSAPAKALNELLAIENAKRTTELVAVPRHEWPWPQSADRIGVMLSSKYLVQIFDEGGGMRRLSVNRTTVNPDGRWSDGLTWDELHEIKRQAGFGDQYAVEVYPQDCNVVNVANMRHLWVMPAPLNIGWKRVKE